MSISLCVITKNEEELLEECLHSVNGLVDEMIVVDTGSTDKTISCAKKCKAKVYEYPWNDDFSEARNFSLSKATKDWILVLDADEILVKKDHSAIRDLTDFTEFVGFSFVQRNYTNNQNIVNFTSMLDDPYRSTIPVFTGYYPLRMVRLFKRSPEIKFSLLINESVEPSIQQSGGGILNINLPIHHLQELKDERAVNERQLSFLRIFEKIEKQDPRDIHNLHNIALTHLNFTKDYAKAKQYFKQILSQDSDVLEPYFGLALTYEKEGNLNEAIDIINTAVKRNLNQTINKKALVKLKFMMLHTLCNLYLSVEQYTKAISIYKLLAKIDRTNREIYESKIQELSNMQQNVTYSFSME